MLLLLNLSAAKEGNVDVKELSFAYVKSTFPLLSILVTVGIGSFKICENI